MFRLFRAPLMFRRWQWTLTLTLTLTLSPIYLFTLLRFLMYTLTHPLSFYYTLISPLFLSLSLSLHLHLRVPVSFSPSLSFTLLFLYFYSNLMSLSFLLTIFFSNKQSFFPFLYFAHALPHNEKLGIERLRDGQMERKINCG